MAKSQRPSADKTREQIIKAARQLFVANGFAATSISDIAGKAKINQSLIYHHFGNKEKLWKAIKAYSLSQFQSLSDFDLDKVLAENDFKLFAEQFIRFRFSLYDNNPEIRRMIDWQYLESNPSDLRGFNDELLQRMRQAILNFQTSGQISEKYHPDLIITQLIYWPITFFRAYTDIAPTLSDVELSEYKQQYVQLCVDAVINGASLHSN